jgi:hypothetical protein
MNNIPILYIENNVNFHYEIIETFIVNYKTIIQIDLKNVKIYLFINNNSSFKTYINNKYPNIIFKTPKTYDYYINITIYDKDYNKICKNSKTNFYISHEITSRLKKISNVYFLTPLAKDCIIADILPYSDIKYKTATPIYIIQGSLRRRHLPLLIEILKNKYDYKFIIKILGIQSFPSSLIKYKNVIIFKKSLNYIDYHKEFLDGYCILPLITKKTHIQYYTTKFTSTINYATGYGLKCLIDDDLQKIYNLKNVCIYNNINDIAKQFNETLKTFYINNSKKNIM